MSQKNIRIMLCVLIGIQIVIVAFIAVQIPWAFRTRSSVSLNELTMMEISQNNRVGKNPQINQLDIVNHSRASTGDDPLAYYIENKQQKLFPDGGYLKFCPFVLTEDDLYYQKYTDYIQHLDVRMQCLYAYRGGMHSALAENISCFCWDGSRMIYCSLDGDVFALDEEDQLEFLFHDPDRVPESLYSYYPQILATPEWIVLKNRTNIHVFRTEDQSLSSYADFNPSYGQMFIYENWCILLGCAPKGAEVLDLLTGQITPLNLQIEMDEYCSFEEAHIAADACVFQDKLILSCSFDPTTVWGFGADDVIRNGTYILDFETKTAEKLDEFHYPTLIAAEGRLFGIDLNGKVYDVLPKDD